MAEVFTSTTELLTEYARTHDSVLVSFSGGKDSLVVADLCSRVFKRMTFFYMFTIPGLRVIEEQLDYGRQRWKAEILFYPHWSMVAALRHGVYSPNHISKDELPREYTLNDVYNLARQDSGIQLIASGIKKSDSEFRRKNVAAFQRKNVLTPLRDWNKLEVLAYLALHKIPVPKSSGRSATGIDLSSPSLCWLHDNHPDDFKKLLELFPYAEAAIARRTFFGIK